MALAGVNVTCGYAGFAGFGGNTQALLTGAVWSENLTTAGVSTNTAPAPRGPSGLSVFRVRAAADAWVAVGPGTPNAGQSPRHFVAAGSDYDIPVNPGDKFAWIAA